MATKYTYTIRAGLLLETGYTRDDVRSLVARLERTYPEVSVDIQWSGPVAHRWIGDGSAESDDLHDEVLQAVEQYLQDLEVSTVRKYLRHNGLYTSNTAYLDYPVQRVTETADTVQVWVSDVVYVIAHRKDD